MKWTHNAMVNHWDLRNEEYELLAWVSCGLKEVYICTSGANAEDTTGYHDIEEAKAFAEYAVAYYRVTEEVPTLKQYRLTNLGEQHGSNKTDESPCATGS